MKHCRFKEFGQNVSVNCKIKLQKIQVFSGSIAKAISAKILVKKTSENFTKHTKKLFFFSQRVTNLKVLLYINMFFALLLKTIVLVHSVITWNKH